MNRIRAGLVGLLSAVGLSLATGPVLAQTSDSSTEELIWGLNAELLAVAIPISILVEVILFYTVWRFRADRVEEAKPTKENRRLEITWTVATAIILLFVGVGAYVTLASPAVSAPEEPQGDEMEVQVEPQQFFWTFEYPEENVTVTSTNGELVVPKNETLRFNVTSRDVLHAFHVPGLGLKADAFPGSSNYVQTTVYNEGEYQLYCAEYCGTGHSQMMATVNVTDQETFDAWIEQQKEDE
jgi:cytochrome c oxidase subunit 2